MARLDAHSLAYIAEKRTGFADFDSFIQTLPCGTNEFRGVIIYVANGIRCIQVRMVP